MSDFLTEEEWAEFDSLSKQYEEFTRQALEALAAGIDKPDARKRFLDADLKAGAAMSRIREIIGA